MTDTIFSLLDRADAIADTYGEGDAAGMPSRETWARIAALPPDQPVTLVNFFKMRAQALYPPGTEPAAQISGRTAFGRYTAVSGACLEDVGGQFRCVAAHKETFIGATEDWDIVAVGTYPRPGSLLSLFENPRYRAAYVHRTAACETQRVSLCLGG